MKTLRFLTMMTMGAIGMTTWAAAAPATVTAKEAIRTVGRDRSAQVLNAIVHVMGDGGVPQPSVWRVVAAQSNGVLREYFVGAAGVVSEGAVPRSASASVTGPSVPLSAVQIDSNRAFAIAEKAARAAKIGFDSVSYRLRCLELSEKPAWFLQLNDLRGVKVGEISISASTGKVLRMAWFQPPAPTAAPARPGQATGPVVWNRAAPAVNRGVAGVRNGFGRAGQWIRGKFQPYAAPQYYVPSRGQ
jgi:hypothetical protein